MTQTRDELVQSLKFRKFPVLSDGHVSLVDVMGSEADICDAARISYGAGTKSVSEDTTLIRYLMRHHHGTPLEMAEIKLAVRLPILSVRQWHRHRTWGYNEYSGRYSEMIDSMEKTKPSEWRIQSTSNKQGSDGVVSQWPEGYESGVAFDSRYVNDPYGNTVYGDMCSSSDVAITPQEYLSVREAELQEQIRENYEERLKFGVAREQARKDMPVSNYTEMYAKTDLRNMLGFLALRCDSHAQYEIRVYADTIAKEIIQPLFPNVYEAFLDYMLESISLSRIDQAASRLITMYGRCGLDRQDAEDLFKQRAGKDGLPSYFGDKRCREREECLDKLIKIGVLSLV